MACAMEHWLSILGNIGSEVPRFTYFHATRSLAKKAKVGHYDE